MANDANTNRELEKAAKDARHAIADLLAEAEKADPGGALPAALQQVQRVVVAAEQTIKTGLPVKASEADMPPPPPPAPVPPGPVPGPTDMPMGPVPSPLEEMRAVSIGGPPAPPGPPPDGLPM